MVWRLYEIDRPNHSGREIYIVMTKLSVIFGRKNLSHFVNGVINFCNFLARR